MPDEQEIDPGRISRTLIEAILAARPDHGLRHHPLRSWLEWQGMTGDAAAATLQRLAREGRLLICAPLDDVRPDTPILPNHLRLGDPLRFARALLGAPDEEARDADGAIMRFHLSAPRMVDSDHPGAADRAGEDAPPHEPPEDDLRTGINGLPPRRLAAGERLCRELRFDGTDRLIGDVVSARPS